MMIRLFVICCLLLTGNVQASQAQVSAEHLHSFVWRSKADKFGGFSAIELTPDGSSGWIVSDGGFIGAVALTRDPSDHKVTDVTGYAPAMLIDPDGHEVKDEFHDAEGLALTGAGKLFISYEALHRVEEFAGPGQKPISLPGAAEFAQLQKNSSLETLALTPQGALIAIPERSGLLTRPFPVFRFKNGRWDTSFTIPRVPPFLPVGGDFGPDGKFYLLERHLNGFFGFQSRVRRFDFDPDAGFSNETILFTSPSARHDNLEGLSVWRDDKGRIRLTMISDNNFKAFQRTEIVEYLVNE